MINKLVIFGGTFNPIHNGHINMALETQGFLGGPEECKIVFVPNKSSVWKKEDISAEDKLNMVKLSIKGYKGFEIDEFELNNKDDNYSYLTVRYFKEKYANKDIKLYFLIGTDQAKLFHKWKKAEEVATNCQILYFSRPGESIDNDNVRKFNIVNVKSDKLCSVSSSDVRELKSLDIQDCVLKYISEHNLYYCGKMSHYIDEHRLNHSKSVALLCKKIADSNNIKDSYKYYIAGLLHDIGKDVPKDVCEEIETTYKRYMPMDPRLYHQFYGCYIAKDDFGINDEEILDAIRYHATGKPNMSKMGKTVYASDKTDPLRGYDSSDMIDALLKDIDDGFVYVLSENKKHLLSKGRDISNLLTKECFEFYLK